MRSELNRAQSGDVVIRSPRELTPVGLALVTLAFLERVLRYVEGRHPERPASAARLGALVTGFVGLALIVGL